MKGVGWRLYISTRVIKDWGKKQRRGPKRFSKKNSPEIWHQRCWEHSGYITFRQRRMRTQRQPEKKLNGSLGTYVPATTHHFGPITCLSGRRCRSVHWPTHFHAPKSRWGRGLQHPMATFSVVFRGHFIHACSSHPCWHNMGEVRANQN